MGEEWMDGRWGGGWSGRGERVSERCAGERAQAAAIYGAGEGAAGE
jgi:hypothetical protein